MFLGFCCWLTPITPTVLCASTCSDVLLDFRMVAELVWLLVVIQDVFPVAS